MTLQTPVPHVDRRLLLREEIQGQSVPLSKSEWTYMLYLFLYVAIFISFEIEIHCKKPILLLSFNPGEEQLWPRYFF